jgi:hypothetical protein
MRPVVILDMDETLLHTPEDQFDDWSSEGISSIPRPGLHKFIDTVRQIGEVWVLSAGDASYIPLALDSVGILGEIKGWRSSRTGRSGMAKILNGRRWVLVDDRAASTDLTSSKLAQCGGLRSGGNLIVVKPFTGDPQDRVLSGLPGLIGMDLILRRM